MFQKLRSDLVAELNSVKLLLVNADSFGTNGHRSLIKNGLNGRSVEILREQGVECVAFSGSRSEEISSVAENLGIVLHEAVFEKEEFYTKMKAEYSLMDNEIALIFRDKDDLEIVKKVTFSVVTPDASLDVKAFSYYAAYGVGSHAVEEIAELIIKAKRYPDGWSE